MFFVFIILNSLKTVRDQTPHWIVADLLDMKMRVWKSESTVSRFSPWLIKHS